ncbi:hypothetical protein [Xanthomonas sp. NCPPB 2632]|uniref:hypothetical protein n=1 Tax=Xanthomonas sp. NCPPB 2632 TaxID=3240912 RepID=UPI0035178A39
MRKVNRASVKRPDCLDAKDSKGKSELMRAKAHQRRKNPKGAFIYKAYRHDDVRRALALLFHGKCAYCETFYSASAPVDVEHYRPKGGVSEAVGHPGYWWLAMCWENLLPSCIDCNRERHQRAVPAGTELADPFGFATAALPHVKSGKQDHFPLDEGCVHVRDERGLLSAEKPLLLDPTVDDPREHLHFSVHEETPLGLVLPGTPSASSKRGAKSIEVYGLNRLGLVQERTRILRQLEFMGGLALELGCIIQDLSMANIANSLPRPSIQDFPARLKFMQDMILGQINQMADGAAPYSEMVRSWKINFIERLGG